MIKYLQRADIDDKKWNGCVHYAINSFPYGYTWYLDNIAETWDGLVFGDYEMVFPLVWQKKLKIDFLYQPLFAQQLGIFFLKTPDEKLLHEFLDNIPANFKSIDINLNYLNKVTHPAFEISGRKNFQLHLFRDYEMIAGNYSDNTKRNLRKAEKAELSIKRGIKPEMLVAFLKEHIGNTLPEVKPFHYHAMHRLIYKAISYQMGEAAGVFNKDNQLLATGFFLFGTKRIINLFPTTSDEGKKCGAGFLLIDYIIRANAGRSAILDFEGSMIESIARFYKGFGAEEVNYWRLKRNDLPWYLKIFKK